MSNLKIKFTGFKEIRNHTEYLIEIDNLTTSESWQLSHRYSYLRSIYNTLKKFSSIPFPKKKLFGNKTSDFVQRRKVALEEYFSKVFQNEELLKVLQNLKFLKFEEKKIKHEPKVKDEKVEDRICQKCVAEKCWEIVNTTQEMLLDFSCHPGSLNEEDFVSQHEYLVEKCKDIKFNDLRFGICCQNVEKLQDKVQSSEWIIKALDLCIVDNHGAVTSR